MNQSILFTGGNTKWLSDLRKRFEQSGYAVRVLEGNLLADDDYDINQVDILITLDGVGDAILQQQFTELREKLGDDSPLIIALYDDIADELDQSIRRNQVSNLHNFVDVSLPAQSVLLEQQILDFYRIHKQKQTLQKQNRQLQAEMHRQRQTINEFEILKNAIVRNISHELKTPLLQVKSAVALLAEETDSSLITYATNATAKLEILIKNITMLGSSLDVNLIPIIPRDVVESAKRNILRIWEYKDAEKRIKLHLATNLDPVVADKQGLNTVLQLLMDNALKFSSEVVEVHVERDDEFIVFSVIDHGIGIEKERLNDIFDLFVQVDSSSTRRYGGAGVGLALVKLILDHHNTKIHVQSDVEHGSVFSFKLHRMNIGKSQSNE